jgi:hypothetical protein
MIWPILVENGQATFGRYHQLLVIFFDRETMNNVSKIVVAFSHVRRVRSNVQSMRLAHDISIGSRGQHDKVVADSHGKVVVKRRGVLDKIGCVHGLESFLAEAK